MALVGAGLQRARGRPSRRRGVRAGPADPRRRGARGDAGLPADDGGHRVGLPNLAPATLRLQPRGVVAVADPDEPPLPFADAAFDPSDREPEHERAEAEVAGLEVVGQRMERLRMEFLDIGAVMHLLRKVIQIVPGFTVEAYRDRLLDLHRLIDADGVFVARSSRMLVEAREPAARTRPAACCRRWAWGRPRARPSGPR